MPLPSSCTLHPAQPNPAQPNPTPVTLTATSSTLAFTYIVLRIQIGPPCSDEQLKAALVTFLCCKHGDCHAVLHEHTYA